MCAQQATADRAGDTGASASASVTANAPVPAAVPCNSGSMPARRRGRPKGSKTKNRAPKPRKLKGPRRKGTDEPGMPEGAAYKLKVRFYSWKIQENVWPTRDGSGLAIEVRYQLTRDQYVRRVGSWGAG